MQFWFKVNNESELQRLSSMMKSGLTTNVVGPFLSATDKFDLDFLEAFPNVVFWDESLSDKDDFATLEVLAAKAAYGGKVKFIVESKLVGGSEFLIQTREVLGAENICLYIKEDISSDVTYLKLLNFDFHSILYCPYTPYLEYHNRLASSESNILLRNYYMKKTRIGCDFNTGDKNDFNYDNEVRGFISAVKPDFVLINLDQYDNGI